MVERVPAIDLSITITEADEKEDQRSQDAGNETPTTKTKKVETCKSHTVTRNITE